MGMTARLVRPKDLRDYDAYLRLQAQVPPFALSAYADVLRASYPVDTPLFVARNAQGAVTGVLSTYLRRGPTGGRRLFSPPYGLVAGEAESGRVLLDALGRFCRDKAIVLTAVTSGPQEVDAPFRSWTKTTVLKRLSGGPDETWAAFRAETRNIVRKAEKNGVTVQRGFESLAAFYRIYVARMSSLSLSIHSFGYFQTLAERLAGSVELFTAHRDGKVLGGTIFLYGSGSALYLYNALTEWGRSLGANDLIMWEAIKDCLARGICHLDLSEATPGSGVYKFKTREIGGEPREVYYYDVMAERNQQPMAAQRPSVPIAYRLARFVAPRMPPQLRQTILRWNKQYERLV